MEIWMGNDEEFYYIFISQCTGRDATSIMGQIDNARQIESDVGTG